MTRRLRQNFSRLHAAVLQAPDRNRTVLVETLTKLGLAVCAFDPSGDGDEHEAALEAAPATASDNPPLFTSMWRGVISS